MSETKCQECDGTDFDQDNGYIVCTNCGHVADNGTQFADDPMQVLVPNSDRLFSGQNIKKSYRGQLDASGITAVKRMGVQMAETLAVNYCFSAEMKDYLMNLYTQALVHELFYSYSLKKKRILAAVCAYISLLNHNESLAILNICSAVGCTGPEFNQIYGLVLKAYPEVKPEVKPIEELVPSLLTEFKWDAMENEMKELRQRVVDIISIEKACWLVDGRSPLHVIIAATYLAWKSLMPSKRAAVDFTEFCKQCKINYKKTSSQRIKEFNDVFIRLAKHIPAVKSVKKSVNRNNIAFFIDDIIQYPNSLIYDLKREVIQKYGQKENNCEDKWMKSFKRSSKRKKNETKEDPICGLRMQDISDTEIDGYIRNEKEVKKIKKLRKLVKEMNDRPQE